MDIRKHVPYDSALSVVPWRLSKGIYLCINYSVSTIVLKTLQLKNAFREIVRPQSPGGRALARAGQTWAGLVRERLGRGQNSGCL